MKELAVIIPLYNEEENAERCINAVCFVLKRDLPETRLIVVNDGSNDKTVLILAKLKDQGLSFTCVSHPHNRGFGAALTTGMQTALSLGCEYGLVMDSDLTNDPDRIADFAALLRTDRYDLIKASRFIRGGGMRGVPLRRQLFSYLGNFIARKLFNMGITDCTNGFHAVRLSLVANASFKERGFPFLLEELCLLKRLGARATELPYILTSRSKNMGESKFNYSPQLIWSYLKYALQAATLRRQSLTRPA